MNKFFKTSAIFFIISNVFITTLNADDSGTNTDLFKDLKLPQACIPERMQKGVAIDNNTCHCPPVSYCTEKVSGGNKLPQFIQNMCCPPPPEPTCETASTDSDFYKNNCIVNPCASANPPASCTIPPVNPCASANPPASCTTPPVDLCASANPPASCTTPPPVDCSTPGTICPQDPIIVKPQECEINYYKSNEMDTAEETKIGTRTFGYCQEYQYTVPRGAADSSNPNGRKMTILQASQGNSNFVYKDGVIADALDELNACLKEIEPLLVDYIRQKDSLFRNNAYLTTYPKINRIWPFKDTPERKVYYLDQENTWQREYVEMFNQLILKNYIDARSECFANSQYREVIPVSDDTDRVSTGTLQSLIQDDEYNFNNWALLELSDNVTDEQVLNLPKKDRIRYSDADRWVVRATINTVKTIINGAKDIKNKIFGDNNPSNNERKQLVNKFRTKIDLKIGNDWEATKKHIADKDNDLFFGEKIRDIPKFTAKTYGPLNHTTVNQAYGIFSNFMNNTYSPKRMVDNEFGLIYNDPATKDLSTPLYSNQINNIDQIIGEIPAWFNTKDGWKIIKGIKRAIAKTGPDGYFYRQLTRYNDGGLVTNIPEWIRWIKNGQPEANPPADELRFKNLPEVTGEHYKMPPIVKPKDSPITTGTNSNFGNWGINCKKVHFVGLCITTFAKDSSGETCLAPETKVTMGDGTTKLIKDIKAGEAVRGKDGKAVTVESVTELDWGSLTLYNINDGLLRLTADHPIMTKDGWRAVNYHFRNDNHEEDRYGLKDVKPLKVGDVIITENGEIPVTRIMPEATVKDGKTFNLKLKDNAKSFFANGIRVRSQN